MDKIQQRPMKSHMTMSASPVVFIVLGLWKVYFDSSGEKLLGEQMRATSGCHTQQSSDKDTH